jgi:drug/metabolite transporter (DMT)-like permease
MAGYLTLCLVWGTTYLAIRFAIETLPPFLMAAARVLVAGALLYAWARWRGAARPGASAWKPALIVGALLLLGGQGAVAWAEQRVPSGLTAVLAASLPIWVVILEWLRPGGTRPSRRMLVGVLAGFGGVVVLVGPWQGGVHAVNLWGVAAIILACISYAAGSLYLHRVKLPGPQALGSGMQLLCGGALLLLAGTASGQWGQLASSHVSLLSLLSLAYLILFGTLLGFSVYAWLLRKRRPALVSTYAYVNPVVALLLGWAFANETLSLRTWLATGIVIAGVVLVTTEGSRRPAGSIEAETVLVELAVREPLGEPLASGPDEETG